MPSVHSSQDEHGVTHGQRTPTLQGVSHLLKSLGRPSQALVTALLIKTE